MAAFFRASLGIRTGRPKLLTAMNTYSLVIRMAFLSRRIMTIATHERAVRSAFRRAINLIRLLRIEHLTTVLARDCLVHMAASFSYGNLTELVPLFLIECCLSLVGTFLGTADSIRTFRPKLFTADRADLLEEAMTFLGRRISAGLSQFRCLAGT